MATVIATVLSTSGDVWARDEDGDLRKLEAGDQLYAGETLVTAANANVQLDFGDGSDPVSIPGGQEIAMTPGLAPNDASSQQGTDADDETIIDASVLDQDVQDVIAALNDAEQGNLLDQLEAPAAGAGGGDGGGGHDFVALSRIALEVGSLDYNYPLAQALGPLDTPEFAGLPDDGGTTTVPDVDVESITLLNQGEGTLEGNVLTYNVTLSGPTANDTTFTFNLGGGTAEPGDYDAPPKFSDGVTLNLDDGTITVPAGVTDFTVEVPTIDDSIDESNETVPLEIDDVPATGVIIDNDEPTITVDDGNPENDTNDVAVTEGTDDYATFNVDVTGAANGSYVTLSLTDDGAEHGSDYAYDNVDSFQYSTDGGSTWTDYNAGDQIAVAGGDHAVQVRVDINDDAIDENAEDFQLHADLVNGGDTNDTHAAVGAGTITDNDEPSVESIDLTDTGDTVVEGNDLEYQVTLTTAPDSDTTFDFNLGGGTAGSGDYTTPPTFSNGVTYNSTTGEITVPAGVTDFTVTVPTVDDTIDESSETVPLEIDGVSATGTITDNDEPTQITISSEATVSEEGLSHGLAYTDPNDPDTNPDDNSTEDTTDSTTVTGTFDLPNADSPTVTFDPDENGQPNQAELPDTIGDTNVTWSLGDNPQTLFATNDAGESVVKITVNNSDNTYNVELLGPIDHPASGEDQITFTVPITVKDGDNTATADLTINIEDDSPVSEDVTESVTIKGAATNLLLILDTSGSMVDPSGVDGKSRLDVMKDAVNQLLNSYEDVGAVRVQLVTFSDGAGSESHWVSVAEARDIVNDLEANGATNYDAAITEAQKAFATDGALGDGQNISYFLSDGNPTESDEGHPNNDGNTTNTNLGDGIDNDEADSEQGGWETFLKENVINSYAIGVGDNVEETYLRPIGYNGVEGDDSTGSLDDNTVVVTDLSQLPTVLTNTVSDVQGYLFDINSTNGMGGFGADGGHVQSVTIGDTTYDYTDGDVVDGVLTIVTDSPAGELIINMDSAKYEFNSDGQAVTGTPEIEIKYTLVDGDGDVSQESTTIIEFTDNGDMDETLTGVPGSNTLDGGAGADTLVGGAGDETLNGGANDDVLRGDAGADTLDGGSGYDYVDGGAGADKLDGGAGYDRIDGGAGADNLWGGDGADTFAWSLGDEDDLEAGDSAVTDTVHDFDGLEEGDKIDLSDLLQGANHDNIEDYLHFSEDTDGSTLMHVATHAGYDSDGSGTGDGYAYDEGEDAGQTELTIHLKGVSFDSLDSPGYSDPGRNDQEIAQQMIDNGTLDIDG